MTANKNLVLGVGGGIAAYKACDLISPLREAGFATRVAMTPAATRFVTPLTFASLTSHPVLVDDLGDGRDPDPTIPHIAWARWADLVAIVPATADLLGRIAGGLAGDSLTALLLALESTKPIVLAPAMNTQMWENPFVADNVAKLRRLGGERIRIVEPVAKRLACGEVGIGGLAGLEEILAEIRAAAAAAPARVR
jgi:phosphopantothenoylcysteine synthetase/decarboxylase